MEYENTKNEIQINTLTNENIVMDSNEPEIAENEISSNETLQEDNTIMLQNEKLDQIHEDLGVICSFLILFALVIVFRYVYRFFNIFF